MIVNNDVKKKKKITTINSVRVQAIMQAIRTRLEILCDVKKNIYILCITSKSCVIYQFIPYKTCLDRVFPSPPSSISSRYNIVIQLKFYTYIFRDPFRCNIKKKKKNVYIFIRVWCCVVKLLLLNRKTLVVMAAVNYYT